jgi:hypothetical protein
MKYDTRTKRKEKYYLTNEETEQNFGTGFPA